MEIDTNSLLAEMSRVNDKNPQSRTTWKETENSELNWKIFILYSSSVNKFQLTKKHKWDNGDEKRMTMSRELDRFHANEMQFSLLCRPLKNELTKKNTQSREKWERDSLQMNSERSANERLLIKVTTQLKLKSSVTGLTLHWRGFVVCIESEPEVEMKFQICL